MSDAKAPLTGPDLKQGVPESQVPDGGVLLGQADGEAVLVVHRGEEWFAVGATCTHYGGPLAEGLVVGDQVRCPWHHAGFSLRSGEPVRAPALNPIAIWRIDRRNGLIRVTSRGESGTVTSPGKPPTSVVIVGAGAAGQVALETLRRESFAGRIVLVGAETSGPVDRPNLSKDYLAGTAPEDWIPLRSKEWYEEQHIELQLGQRVTAIDPVVRTVTFSDGSQIAYGKLLLCTGASPIGLSIPGAELPHVHLLRSLDDSRAIIAGAQKAKRAVIIGASFIALEVAAALRTRGLEVAVVGREAIPLERALGKELGEFVRRLHEEHGVVFHLGAEPASITASEVTLRNGARLPADLVVAGLGVRPNVELAQKAGLRVEDGVVVDGELRTSSEHIFAAGDMARFPDPHTGQLTRIEHWVLAQRMGATAARNILGRHERFTHAPFFWSQHYDVPIASIGNGRGWEKVEVQGNIQGRDCTVSYWAGGKVLAVATIYRDRVSLEAEAAWEQGDQTRLAELARR